MAKNLVCGMELDEKQIVDKVEYEEKTYYFCFPACKENFEKNPKQYVKMKAEKDVEGLIKVLKDKNKDIHEKAAETLGEVVNARAIEPLIQALGDRDNDVRGEAARALGKVGDERAVEPLTQALKDKDVQEAAKEALEKIRWKSA